MKPVGSFLNIYFVDSMMMVYELCNSLSRDPEIEENRAQDTATLYACM